jgi:hypothetical protein
MSETMRCRIIMGGSGDLGALVGIPIRTHGMIVWSNAMGREVGGVLLLLHVLANLDMKMTHNDDARRTQTHMRAASPRLQINASFRRRNTKNNLQRKIYTPYPLSISVRKRCEQPPTHPTMDGNMNRTPPNSNGTWFLVTSKKNLKSKG